MTREPIPDCPMPETPIRERAWSDAQRADMHRDAFDLWRKLQPCRETLFPYDIAWASWQAAMRYRDEQEKQA